MPFMRNREKKERKIRGKLEEEKGRSEEEEEIGGKGREK